MIIATMSAKEIITEYKKDYSEILKPRFLKFLEHKTHDLKIAKGNWIKIKNPLIIKSNRGNSYTSFLKAKLDKKQGLGFSSVIYTEINDTKTGKKVVYLFSDDIPIKFQASFIKELKINFKEFLNYGCTWDIRILNDIQDEKYSSWINFGEKIGIGVGGWEDNILVIRHLYITKSLINPIEEFLKTREENTEKSEIDQAWDDYYSGKLTPF